MNRPLLALALCLGCVSLAIVGTSAALLMETEGATVIERPVLVVESVERLVYVPITVTPTAGPVRPMIVRGEFVWPTPTPDLSASGVVLIGE